MCEALSKSAFSDKLSKGCLDFQSEREATVCVTFASFVGVEEKSRTFFRLAPAVFFRLAPAVRSEKSFALAPAVRSEKSFALRCFVEGIVRSLMKVKASQVLIQLRC